MSAFWETTLGSWVQQNQATMGVVGLVSAAIFLVGLVLGPVILTRMPADYFMEERAPLARLFSGSPALRGLVVVLKNAVGFVLAIAGLLMLVLPGQGVLTLLVAFMLMDVPHKRRIELWIVGKAPVLRGVNWVRRKARKTPLLLPEEHS